MLDPLNNSFSARRCLKVFTSSPTASQVMYFLMGNARHQEEQHCYLLLAMEATNSLGVLMPY